jgi:hypothetical protein
MVTGVKLELTGATIMADENSAEPVARPFKLSHA